ncbi:hypothetical protein B0H16DRAFT_1498518 [Mycena metata]|uniref:Uncharacterized protein n=1 Tax=Mycena metata TaxID=1033252 RepID=A0AAD7NYX0_9AGAR|nr:hypothetical protein B0H16DRAFT_1498518 [Mycena metata]
MADPDDDDSFFANVLKPGSSLNPQFLLILDVAFIALFLILVSLAVLTAGNLHIFALLAIELGLWASVKWFVHELQNTPLAPTEGVGSKKDS